MQQMEDFNEKISDEDLSSLITKHEQLAQRIAGGYARQVGRLSLADLDDLVQEGLLGLMKAAETFDPQKGASFGSYARMRIRFAILDYLRQVNPVSKSVYETGNEIKAARRRLGQRLQRSPTDQETADELGIAVEKYHELKMRCRTPYEAELPEEDDQPDLQLPSDSKSPHRLAEDSEKRRVLDGLIGMLKEQEQKVIRLHFEQGLSLTEIAGHMKVSLSRVSQVRSKALWKLRYRCRRLYPEFAAAS